MSICQNCGADTDDEICWKCGTRIDYNSNEQQGKVQKIPAPTIKNSNKIIIKPLLFLILSFTIDYIAVLVLLKLPQNESNLIFNSVALTILIFLSLILSFIPPVIQTLIFQFFVAGTLKNTSKMNQNIYLATPVIHFILLVVMFSMIQSTAMNFVLGNLVFAGLVVGALHLYFRIKNGNTIYPSTYFTSFQWM